jgi:hypothetical protein
MVQPASEPIGFNFIALLRLLSHESLGDQQILTNLVSSMEYTTGVPTYRYWLHHHHTNLHHWLYHWCSPLPTPLLATLASLEHPTTVGGSGAYTVGGGSYSLGGPVGTTYVTGAPTTTTVVGGPVFTGGINPRSYQRFACRRAQALSVALTSLAPASEVEPSLEPPLWPLPSTKRPSLKKFPLRAGLNMFPTKEVHRIRPN